MDYPKSVPSVGLVDGKFVDENQASGTPGSLIPAQWGNAVTQEILAVIAAGGLTPDEQNNTQLLAAIKAVVSPGRLLNIRSFGPGSATYTPTPGTASVEIEVQGGGGGGGGTSATSSTQISIGAGGSAGAYSRTRLTSGFAGQTVTVGAGGSATAGASGGTGGASSFGSLVTCPGGYGGVLGGAGANNTSTIVLGTRRSPQPSGGNIDNLSGSAGVSGFYIVGVPPISGGGGNSNHGTGGSSLTYAPGDPANGYGAGGGGACANVSSAALAGGTGTSGVVIIREYA